MFLCLVVTDLESPWQSTGNFISSAMSPSGTLPHRVSGPTDYHHPQDKWKQKYRCLSLFIPPLGYGLFSMKHLGSPLFGFLSLEESGYKRRWSQRICSHCLQSWKENDNWHGYTDQPKWRKWLSPRIQRTAEDTDVIIGTGMGDMSRASRVCPLTT